MFNVLKNTLTGPIRFELQPQKDMSQRARLQGYCIQPDPGKLSLEEDTSFGW